MSHPVNGTDVVLYKHDDALNVDYAFAAAKSCTFQIQADMKEVTSQTSAWYREFKADTANWSMSCEGLIKLQDYNYLYLTDLQKSRESILVKFVVDNGADGLVIYSGRAYIASITMTGPFNDAATYSVQLQGTGPYSQVGTSVTPAGILVQGGNVLRKEYTVPSESTSITIATILGASEILEIDRGSAAVTQILYAGSPVGNQIKVTLSGVTFQTSADQPFLAGEELVIIYK